MDRFTPSKSLKTIQEGSNWSFLTILPDQLLRFLEGVATCVLTNFILRELLKIFVISIYLDTIPYNKCILSYLLYSVTNGG